MDVCESAAILPSYKGVARIPECPVTGCSGMRVASTEALACLQSNYSRESRYVTRSSISDVQCAVCPRGVRVVEVFSGRARRSWDATAGSPGATTGWFASPSSDHPMISRFAGISLKEVPADQALCSTLEHHPSSITPSSRIPRHSHSYASVRRFRMTVLRHFIV